MLIRITISIFPILFSFIFADDYCYLTNRETYQKLFVTKTKYSTVRSHDLGKISRSSVKDCTPVFAYLLTRHATRSPSKEFLKNIDHLINNKSTEYLLKNIKSSKQNLCKNDQRILQHWSSPWSYENGKGNQVSKYTLGEVIQLGRQFSSIIPNLLKQNQIGSNSVLLRSTNTQRTIETLKSLFWSLTPDYNTTNQEAFMKKYFSSQKISLNLIKEDDRIFSLYKSCPSYDKIREQSLCDDLCKNYLETHLPESALEAISQRLSIDYSFL
ncbi:hypothetical protein SNEBB_000609 [Seison nebaliae]|nr:hypothetical protein SNEBB_000609 [Seison nebaliae]